MNEHQEQRKTNPLVVTDQDHANLEKILGIRSRNKSSWTKILKREENSYLVDWLNSKTPLLQDEKYNMLTKLYWVLHGMIDFCLCPSCHQIKLEKNVDSFEKGYFRACSTQCAAANPERTRKYEATMMKNYGSTNFFTSEAGKKK